MTSNDSMLQTTIKAFQYSKDKAWFIKGALKLYKTCPLMFQDRIDFLEKEQRKLALDNDKK